MGWEKKLGKHTSNKGLIPRRHAHEKHMKRRSASLRKAQAKSTVRYRSIPTRIVITKQSNKCYWDCGQVGTLVTTVGNVKSFCCCGEHSKPKNRITMWSSCSICGYITKKAERKDLTRRVYTRVHSGIIHSSQKVETTLNVRRWVTGRTKRVCIQQNVIQP